MPDRVTWPVVALVTVILAALFGMAAIHAPTDVIVSMVVLLGLGAGVGQLSSIKTNVNGNLSKLIEQLGAAMDKLHHSSPPPEDKPY